MRRSSWISLPCIVAVVLAECAATAHVARADETSPAPASSAAAASAPTAPHIRTLSPAEWDALSLGRAVDLWLKGDIQGAAQLLETIDTSPASSFPQADRAVFLLALAYLRLNYAKEFDQVAMRAGDGSGSLYRQWIRYGELVTSPPGASAPREAANELKEVPGAEILAAARLIDMGRPDEGFRCLENATPHESLVSIHLYLRAIALEAAKKDPTRAWEELASHKARNVLEADLVATARIRLATARLERGEDVREMLDRVPRESRLWARAMHIQGLYTLQVADVERGRQILADIVQSQPTYAGRRDVKLALGGLAMDREHFHAALRYFESAEDNWIDEYESFTRLEDDDALADIWVVWDQQQLWSTEIRLSPVALLDELFRLSEAALDLTRDPSLAPSKGLAEGFWPSASLAFGAPWDSTNTLSRHSPRPEEWKALRALQQERRETVSAIAREERVISERTREIERRVHYIRLGRDQATESTASLADGVARLGTILGRLDIALMQLEAARDSTLALTARRTRAMAGGIRQNLLFMDAMRHFYVNGPKRAEDFPAGVPSPAEVLSMEDSLASEVDEFDSLFATGYPTLINRSFTEIWRPKLAGKSVIVHRAMRDELGRSRAVAMRIDSLMTSYADDAVLAAARVRRDELLGVVDALRRSEQDLRRQIARAVATRARTQLEGEREAIDYHLGDACYELAVQAAATEGSSAGDSTTAVAYRETGIARIDTFLKRYPQSIARGESRFRLADLRLAQARDEFQGRMAQFLGERPSADDLGNRSLSPFVNYAPAVALYEAILTEDRDFPHMDAVLFNLGMILSDDGDPAGATHLRHLVDAYPDSPHCQEAWLRMGSDHFDRKDFAGSVTLFEKAAGGDNPSFAVIALYKLGWAQFEEDQFLDAADAFRRLIDLYAEHEDIAKTMNLRNEAEEYLVHCLARSGGADAFRSYFDAVGARDYEQDLLLSLGHLMRSTSLYKEAVSCDELWLSRYPLHPKAFAVAERLVGTYRSWNKPEAARTAKLSLADRFLPGSAWNKANTDATSRQAAEEFARSAYREAAAYDHEKARKTDDTASWQSALANYERYLAYWPNGDESARIHYVAGEAAFRLQRYKASLGHFAVAARSSADIAARDNDKSASTTDGTSDPKRMAIDASWQQVAVTDAWYRSSQAAGSARGADSLATKLLATAADFVGRFPQDQRSADIIWRVGNVAYTHDWYAEAAGSLSMLAERYPRDPRAVRAMRMCGDAHYRRANFEAAGVAYEKTLPLAQAAGQDSVVTVLEATIPLCYFKHAESVAKADSQNGDAKAAPLFAELAARWPRYAHADLALYRAGLGFAKRDSRKEAIDAWERLLAEHPTSEYARDSAVQIATLYEKSGDKRNAARAYERFSRLHPKDPDAPAALLKSIDLLADAKDDSGAEQMRSLFVDRFPGEVETVMAIRAERAARELSQVAAGQVTLSSLLASQASTGAARAEKTSELQAYLALAAANPSLASPSITAQVDFLAAEEAYPSYASLRLTQPLPEAIEQKKTRMEELLKSYERCGGHGIAEYARAAAYRIGQVLVEFGDALEASERPHDLNADDLAAYDEVLREQSWAFYGRGMDVWSNLLKEVGDAPDDPGQWIARTRQSLWPRLAQRFLYQPEVDYPLVVAIPPKESN